MIGRYRINTPTLALVQDGARQVVRTVPIGAIITVDRRTLHGKKFIEVLWDGEKAMMFVQDLTARGEVIDDPSSLSS